MLPWRFMAILSVFLAIIFIVHLVNLFGVETGRLR
jgi:hypothetical protein